MIRGLHIVLRPIQDQDWPVIEEWGREREALWGPFQRFQLDHLPLLRQAYQETGLLKRESGLLLVETLAAPQVVGFVRYTLIPYPDADLALSRNRIWDTRDQRTEKGLCQGGGGALDRLLLLRIPHRTDRRLHRYREPSSATGPGSSGISAGRCPETRHVSGWTVA
jgi:hypothetical protein